MKAMKNMHVKEPHWYLYAIAVKPEHQGKAVGSALMKCVLARADKVFRICNLEIVDAPSAPEGRTECAV